MIPRLLHFIWFGREMPEYCRRNIDEFRRLNPDFTVMLHDETALDPDYRDRFDRITDTTSKSDLVRYSVLQRYGGWYFDCDYWPFRPIADIERAWSLDGRKIFLAQAWGRSNPAWLGNAIIGSGRDLPIWSEVKRRIIELDSTSRIAYGPTLFTQMACENERQFVIAGEPWFNGIKPQWSGRIYRHIINGGDPGIVPHLLPETGGQLPFAMHLWAWKYESDLTGSQSSKSLAVYGSGRRHAAVVVSPNFEMSDGSLFVAVAKGLADCGFTAEMVRPAQHALSHCSEIPSIVVVWNGLQPMAAEIVRQAASMGIPVIRLEHGFYNRGVYLQADHEGFLHRASWRRQLSQPAPLGSADRLAEFYPNGITPTRQRDGYILAIGQVPGDTQMFDSEIQGPVPLNRVLLRAIPKGVQAYFRPHPQCARKWNPSHKRLPELPLPDQARQQYATTKAGVGLDAALAGAAFIVTINSNAIVEALAAGVPVLAFGPSLAIDAGVARQATVATLADDIRAMLEGWTPRQDAVENYLRWLAARQWSRAEFAEGGVLAELLQAAGVAVERAVEREVIYV